MYKKNLSITQFYEKVIYHPKNNIVRTRDDFIGKYKKVLTDKECEYLKSCSYNIANFYMLPNLYKSQQLNEIPAQNPYIVLK